MVTGFDPRRPNTYRAQPMSEVDQVVARMAESYRRQAAQSATYSLTAGSSIPAPPTGGLPIAGSRGRPWRGSPEEAAYRQRAAAAFRAQQERQDREYRAQRLADVKEDEEIYAQREAAARKREAAAKEAKRVADEKARTRRRAEAYAESLREQRLSRLVRDFGVS